MSSYAERLQLPQGIREAIHKEAATLGVLRRQTYSIYLTRILSFGPSSFFFWTVGPSSEAIFARDPDGKPVVRKTISPLVLLAFLSRRLALSTSLVDLGAFRATDIYNGSQQIMYSVDGAEKNPS